MKIIKSLSLAILTLPIVTHAEVVSPSSQLNPLTQLSNVRVSMQRMLQSTDDQYFLSLFAGVANPKATLTILGNSDSIKLKGTQKGNDLTLNADTTTQPDIEVLKQITGVLDSNTGVFQTKVLIDDNWQNIQFEPAFKVENKPLFTFKFYGVKADTQAREQLLTRVEVINKTTKKVAQTLTGFSAFPNSIGYMDINFDGYYDVILSDLSQDRKLEDKRFIYWMYNPKTQQFQRSPQLEKVVGFPNLHGEKQQINFGNGQLFQVKNGLLNQITSDE